MEGKSKTGLSLEVCELILLYALIEEGVLHVYTNFVTSLFDVRTAFGMLFIYLSTQIHK